MADLLNKFYENADTASNASRANFPNQEWDNTQRNAMRHAMWVGGMAKQLGAGPNSPMWNPFAQTMAKGVGYGNELVSYLKRLGDLKTPQHEPGYVRDTLHDLNNNAVGAEIAGMAKTPEDMQRILSNMAFTARSGNPRGLLSMSDGVLSYDQNTGEAKPRILEIGPRS